METKKNEIEKKDLSPEKSEKEGYKCIEPVKDIPAEQLSETIFGVLSDGSQFEAVVSKDTVNESDVVWMKVSFELKGVSPMPVVLEIEGNKSNFADKVKEEINSFVQSKNLNGRQDLNYMNSSLYISPESEKSKEKNERILSYSSSRKLISE